MTWERAVHHGENREGVPCGWTWWCKGEESGWGLTVRVLEPGVTRSEQPLKFRRLQETTVTVYSLYFYVLFKMILEGACKRLHRPLS